MLSDMRVSVIGCGYLGAVHAACMAEVGHDVVGIDVDPAKIATLSGGSAPFHEPGFGDVLQRNVDAGRLSFTTEVAAASDAKVHFVAVGTPQTPGSYAADLSYVDAAVDSLLPHLAPDTLVVGKSTVPVGTAGRLAEHIAPSGAVLVWNPEFLREGFAVQDTLTPDRIVYGLSDDPAAARSGVEVLDSVYASLLSQGIPRLTTSYQTAELVKVAANSFLATKISFINAMAELCDVTGADVSALAEAIGYDDRIGPKFLRAGIGFGGGCLPKDIRAFMARAGELGVDQALTFLREVDEINNRRRTHAVELARRAVGGQLSGSRIAVLGAAFKPNSDDMRNSPALDIANALAGQGAEVTITDPAAGPVLALERPDMTIAPDALSAVRGADVVMVLTEWAEFSSLDPVEIKRHVANPWIIDGRNCLDPQAWRAAGWVYNGIGRP